MSRVVVREATLDDIPVLIRLSHALSAEVGVAECRMREEHVRQNGFGPEARFRTLVAERQGEAVGYAVFYPAYDTDHAARGFYMQDLYVVPQARRQGVARALMAALARACEADRGCYLFWNARPQNRAGRAFYRAIGAREEEVLTLSLQPDALRRLAGGS